MDEYGIYYADLNPPTGHEQGGIRPVIVIKSISELDLCVIVPLTTVLKHINLPYTMQINKTDSTNLKGDSIALIFHIRTISSKRIKEKIGKIDEHQMNKIKATIKAILSM